MERKEWKEGTWAKESKNGVQIEGLGGKKARKELGRCITGGEVMLTKSSHFFLVPNTRGNYTP